MFSVTVVGERNMHGGGGDFADSSVVCRALRSERSCVLCWQSILQSLNDIRLRNTVAMYSLR